MNKIVIDANIVVKWFISEEFSDLALKFRDKFVDGVIELLAPNLLGYEVLNALKYNNLFSLEDLENAAKALENYAFIEFPLSGDLVQNVIQIAHNYDISLYDAAYVGLGDFLNIPVITADKKLVQKLGPNFEKKIFYLLDFRMK